MIASPRGAAHRVTPYTIAAEKLSAGSTLASPKAALVIKATGAVEKFYSPDAGTDMFGTLLVRHWDSQSGVTLHRRRAHVTIAPERQEHQIEFSDGIVARERIFVLSEAPRGTDLHHVGPPGAYCEIELSNDGDRTVELASYAALRLRGGFQKPTTAVYDDSANAFVVCSQDDPKKVRIAAFSTKPSSYEVTTDISKIEAERFPGALSNRTIGAADDPIGLAHFENRLEPGESATLSVVLSFAVDGEDAARQAVASLPSTDRALELTRAYYETTLDRAIVMTPDPEINRGVLWAKANMLRSLLLTEQGWCFVNDPTETTKSVARDSSWFAFGADYVVPWFVRESLGWFANHLTGNGMVVEWYETRTGKTETYGLDINDNTALLILALRHHFCVTGDRAFLERIYPAAICAARHIVAKRGSRGLVWCHAPGSGSRGIVGWRNAIQGYRLAGATTELNSECYAALRAVSLMAQELADEKARAEFDRHADQLRTAMNQHLLDPARGVYFLTIDDAGRPQTDLTSDLVFPILFGVADDDVATNIIATLSRPEFWSSAGLHTVPRDALNYSPVDGAGLLGGIWAGPTFWFAAAAARYNPELVAEALGMAFKHYAEDPLRYNTVPGQFCEWLHGETLTNQGMMLSPWFAPKYLWAAIEGVAGLASDQKAVEVRTRLPSHWSWLGVRNVGLRGATASWFTVRTDAMVTYATDPIASVDPARRYERDVSDDARVDGDGVACIALRRADGIALLLGNTLDRTVATALTLENDTALGGQLRLRTYSSLARKWQEQELDSSRLRDGLPVRLDGRGFCVLEIGY